MNNKVLIAIIFILVIGVIVGSIYFINRGENKTNDNSLKEANMPNNSSKNNNLESNEKVAIVYFSVTNITESIAIYIKNATNGDIFEIISEEKYTSYDLDYRNNDSIANREQNDSSARPKISNNINIDPYDIIYLGYPIWWGDVPKIILTFLDSHNLSGKTVIPFCTSNSSSINRSLSILKNYNKNINWIDGKRFGTTSQAEINDWIKSINR